MFPSPRSRLAVALLALAVAGSALASAGPVAATPIGAVGAPAGAPAPAAPAVPGELIVSFEPGTSDVDVAAFYAAFQSAGVSEKENLALSPRHQGGPIRVVTVPAGSETDLAAAIAADPRVALAEPNYIVEAVAIPNDTSFTSLWGLNNTGQTGGTVDADIDAPEAWDVTTGSTSVVVFGIDTGVDTNHPDLVGNLWTNPGEVAGNGLDDDGNGYIDDIHGINAILNNGNPEDDNGHGTHTIGTIGAVGNNATGVVGVNWTSSIGACKFLSAGGSGTTADAIQCFLYVNDLRNVRGIGVRVTNNSWGGGGFSAALQNAMQGLDQPGMPPILHAVAAGNSNLNIDVFPFYPAAYTLANILSVAATDHNDIYAGFSNYGPLGVDIAAPGVSILSTYVGGGYASLQGTSMASPHVAGCAALALAADGTLSASALKAQILNAGDALSPQQKQTLTNDRLNCANAVIGGEVQFSADMMVTKTASPDPALAGQNLTYSVTATNNGPDAAANVSITDQLPTNTTFVSATPSAGAVCSTPAVGALGGTVSCTWAANTVVGGTRTITIVVNVCQDAACGTSVVNNVSVDSDLADPNTANNSFQLTTSVQSASDLAITKTDTPDPVIAGNNLTYSLVVDNLGPSNSAGTVVVDTLDPNTKFVSATVSPAGPTCSEVGGVVTCNLGTMGTGAAASCGVALPDQYTITIEVTVSALTPCSPNMCPGSPGAPLSNTATVSSTNCLADPDLANNTAVELTEVLAGADVLIDAPVVVDLTPNLLAAAGPEAGRAATPLQASGDAADSGATLPLQLGGECVAPGDILEVTQTFSNTGPDAYTMQRNNPGPEFQANHPPQVVGMPGTCTILQGAGTCAVDASTASWNGTIAVGETIQLSYRVRVKGGLPVGTPMTFDGVAHYDVFNIQQNTATRASATTLVEVNCPPTVDPNSALAGQVHLPILNFEGQNDVCRTWIEVQNVGSDFTKAALVTWGEPGFCPPQCAGPLKVECSGLLKPGSTWNFLGSQVPSGSKSGILFSFTAKQLSEIGVNLGFDDIVADVLCETLFFSVVGDCDDYRRFKKAYNEGLEFAGIPLDRAIGEPLAVEVLRNCPGDQTPGAEVSSKYGGIAGIDLGAYDPVFGGYAYYVPLLYAQSAGLDSVMYIQNGGLECSSVEIWFKAQDDCLRARICEIFTLAPGETFQFDANDCVGPDFQGNAWLRSSQPLGIAVDIFGRDILMTYTGVPTELNFTFNPRDALFSIGNQVAYGPLAYSEYQGWDSGIQVQNMSSVTAAKVKVYFLDRSGDVITTLVDWICPRGSQTYFLPVIADLPGSWVGSVRVESQEWFSPGDPLVAPANITGIATLIKYTDAARSDTAEAIAYNLLPEQRAYDWQIGANAGGTESGIGLLAIPSLVKDLDGTGVTTEVAIANLVPKPGFTDFAIYIYDQNGLLDYVCEKLNEKQVEYINFDTWGYINPGFKGSAIVSATFWEHDVFDDTGFFLRNLLGLAAVVVERTGTRLGTDIPGDEAAGTTAIPFREDTEAEFFFDFEGPLAPLCPGLVDDRPEPGQCPETAVVACQDCPLPIQDLQTTSSIIDINTTAIPTQCVVEDVDVLIDITHTFDGDLVVDLSSPDIPDVGLFNSICGASNNIQAILDDEAAQPIGTVCPPLGQQRWDTDPPGQLIQFEGGGTNGAWKLDVFDQFGADQGTLNTWELQFTLSAQ